LRKTSVLTNLVGSGSQGFLEKKKEKNEE